MHMNTTSTFNVNYKEPLHPSNYIDSSIKCSCESYKWTFRSEHAFKVSTISMHTWFQMVTPPLMTLRSKSKQVFIKRFRRSPMSWIFVSCTLRCITPQISKCKAHDDPGPLWWSYDTTMIHLMQFSLVISRCNITFSVFWISHFTR